LIDNYNSRPIFVEPNLVDIPGNTINDVIVDSRPVKPSILVDVYGNDVIVDSAVKPTLEDEEINRS